MNTMHSSVWHIKLDGRILDLICEDYTKGQILDELGLGKSQGYADIKAAQALAKKLYFGE